MADARNPRTTTGRIPGSRGLATRQKLLEATWAAVQSVPYRDISLSAVAREAGSSPATYYHYFKDLDSAMLVLAETMLQESADLASLVTNTSWDPDEAIASATAVVKEFLRFWQGNRVLIRIIELLSEEGDRRFQRVRRKILLDFAEALAAAMEAFQPAADRPYPPLAAAGGLVSMLAHVGSYEADFPSWGMPIEGIRTYMAHVLAQTILGTMHPSAHPALDSL
jgi:AcrR family transcriptional regulator